MGETHLNMPQGWNAIYIFLRSLWDHNAGNFSRHGIGLGAFLKFVNFSFTEDFEWKRARVSAFKKPWASFDLISPGDLFCVMQILVERYKQKCGFDLVEVENVLKGMQTDSLLYETESNLWRTALIDALMGKKWKRLGEYRFSDWAEK
jgi:hypothetical protein